MIVLEGGPDFWSNGIHLNLIEAADHPAEESWRNINAMDDLVREIVDTPDQLTIAALQGNAGAGGVFLALATDRVFARDGVILNPHYKGMGNLDGSEYWTYLLPRRVSAGQAEAITAARLPVGLRGAKAMGLVGELVRFPALTQQKLDPQEGFVVSRVNGEWDVQSILKLCPMHEDDALMIFSRLLERGVIALR